MIFLCGIWMIFPDAVFGGTNAGPNRGWIVTSEPLSWVWDTSQVIPAASSRGLSDGGSGVGKSVACNDSRLCTSSCCLCGNRCEYVLSVVDTFSCPSLSANIRASQPWLISKLACECRYGIITTNRKSLYFQGVWAFVVFYSIPFPSWKLTKTIKKKGGCFINDKI